MYITNEWELRHLAMQNGENLRKKLAWVFIFILVAAASVWAVANQSDDFTVTNFIKYISNASPIYMMSAVLSCLWVLCTMFYTYFLKDVHKDRLKMKSIKQVLMNKI